LCMCLDFGYVYDFYDAPKLCPFFCKFQSYFEVYCENY